MWPPYGPPPACFGARLVIFFQKWNAALAPTATLRLSIRFTQALLATLSLLLAGCASSSRITEKPAAATTLQTLSVSPIPEFKERIDALLPDSLFPPSTVGIMVVSADDGRILYQLNPDLLLMPASNEKLFTSAAALSVLGPDYRFLTTVSVDTGEVPSIFIHGGGDPLLSTEDLDSLARVTSTLLAHDKSWLLRGDVSLFDDVPWGEGWMWDDAVGSDGMAITPLSLNGNAIRIHVRAGTRPGDSLNVIVEPQTAYVTVDNRGITADDTTHPLEVTRRLTDPSNTIIITGTLPPWKYYSTDLAVYEPSWYALRVFSEHLATYGIRCTGMVLDTLTSTAHPLCTFYRRLDSIVTNMNRVSDNLSAECLLKTIGATRWGAPGSAESGVSVIKSFLASHSLDTTRMSIVDGSGVSRYNLTTARNIARLLQLIYQDQKLFPTFYNSLAGPGEHGTLSGRMRRTSAERNLRAKTGTLRGASAFSGYVKDAGGKMLVFSVILQNFLENSRSYRQVQDKIGVILSQWKE